MYLHVNQIYNLKHSGSCFTYSYWDIVQVDSSASMLPRSSNAYQAWTKECKRDRAWFEAKQSPHCTKADALKKSDLQVATGRLLQQVQHHQCRWKPEVQIRHAPAHVLVDHIFGVSPVFGGGGWTQEWLKKGYFRTFPNIFPTSGTNFELLRQRFCGRAWGVS